MRHFQIRKTCSKTKPARYLAWGVQLGHNRISAKEPWNTKVTKLKTRCKHTQTTAHQHTTQLTYWPPHRNPTYEIMKPQEQHSTKQQSSMKCPAQRSTEQLCRVKNTLNAQHNAPINPKCSAQCTNHSPPHTNQSEMFSIASKYAKPCTT